MTMRNGRPAVAGAQKAQKEEANEESSAPPALRAGQWKKELIFVPEEEGRNRFFCIPHSITPESGDSKPIGHGLNFRARMTNGDGAPLFEIGYECERIIVDPRKRKLEWRSFLPEFSPEERRQQASSISMHRHSSFPRFPKDLTLSARAEIKATPRFCSPRTRFS
jgi:hypothetical protein